MRGGHGVHVGNNDRVDNLELKVLSDRWYVLRKATFGYRHRDGRVTREVREAYDRGNGVTILLFDPDAGTVIVTPPVPSTDLPQRSPQRNAHRDRGRPARSARRGP